MPTITTGIESLITAVEDSFAHYDEELRRVPNLDGTAPVAPGAEGATAAEKPKKPSLKAIIRPNGEAYVPREVRALDTTDVAFMQKAYEKKMPVLLYGNPGTGKTALMEAALPGLVTMMGTSETETSDFVGSWVQNPEGQYEWVDGPLVVAMEAGLPMLIDEIALIDTRTMAVVYSVMDGRNELPITANPSRGVAKVKEGFTVYGACNPNVPGAIMSDALLSRFQLHIEIQSDWSLAGKLGVGPKIITVAKNLEKKAQVSEVMAPPQIREVLTFQKISDTFGLDVAIRNFLSQSRPEDRDQFAAALQAVFGTVPTPLTF